MIRCFVLFAFTFVGTSVVRADLPDAPTLDQLKEIAGKAHSETLTLAELKVYPRARKYRIRATMHIPQRGPSTIEFDGNEKWVDGRYVVSSFRFPGAAHVTQMIVTYDAKHHCYRKWVISPEAIDQTMIGTRVGDSRTVSWVTLPAGDDATRRLVISQETHTDSSTKWSELHLEGSQIIARVEGEATVIP